MDKSSFKVIADNKTLFDVLKCTLLEKFDIITTVDTKDNNMLGEMLRASLTGKQNVEEVFREIEKFKTKAPEDEAKNPAR
jgi:hypothetical protein